MIKVQRYYHSLRFKITLGLLLSLIVVLAVTSSIRYISFRRSLVQSLEYPAADTEEIVKAQLAAYVRSRLFLWASSILVIMLITQFMLSKMVVGRLRQFLRAVKQVGLGDLDVRVPVGGRDEIAELADAFNHMAEELQRRDKELSVRNALAATVSQSLDLEEVLHGALDQVLELMKLQAGWITLRDHRDSGKLGEDSLSARVGSFGLVVSRGLSEEAARTRSLIGANVSARRSLSRDGPRFFVSNSRTRARLWNTFGNWDSSVEHVCP